MNKEQYDKAKELDEKIRKYTDLINKIKSEVTVKRMKDITSRENLEKRDDDHGARWTLFRFFKLSLTKQKVILMPHYEFAHGIEMDADPELIMTILDYLEGKKKACETEFEQIGTVKKN